MRAIKNKLNIKRFLIIIPFIVLGGFLIWWMFNSEDVEAEWFNDQWYYRKAITVTNGGTAQTDFQVEVLSSYDMSSDVSAGKVQADFGDLRFTDNSGKILPYWIEDNTASSLNVWVKMPSVPAGDSTVYMYYGNPTAESNQSGNDVFEFFNDFTDGNIGDWTAESSPTTNWTVLSGALRSTTVSSDYSSLTRDGYNFDDFIIDVRWKYSGTTHGGINFRGQTTAADYGYQWIIRPPGNTSRIQKRNPDQTTVVTEASLGMTLSADTWYDLELKAVGTQINGYINGTQVLNGDMGDTEFTSGKVGIQHYDGTNDFDDFRVRKAASVDFSSSLGSEEKGLAPMAYWRFDEGYGSTAYDDSSNNNDGVIDNAIWKSEEFCRAGKCLYFDGSYDRINMAGNGLQLTNNTTLSFWIRLTQDVGYGSHSYHPGMFSVSSGGSYNDFITLAPSGDNARIAYEDASGATRSSDGFPYKTGDWMHISIVMDENRAPNFYVNGEFVGSDSASNYISLNYFGVGYAGATSDGSFKGMMDDMKFYNYARSEDQIKQDYSSGASGGVSGTASMGGKNQSWISDGLVGYWKMDESSWSGVAGEVIDSSGSGNNGQAYYGATLSSGKFGNGGYFDGTDNVVLVPDTNNSLDMADDFTISFWVNPTSAGTKELVAKAAGGNYEIWQSNTDLCVRVNGSNPVVCVSSIFTYEQWTHITVEYKRSDGLVTIYKNGSYFSSGSNTNAASINDSSLQIGAYSNGTSYPFLGKIDEVRIYNRVLSEDEIRWLYEWAPGPIGHWKMEERSGNAVYNTGSCTNCDGTSANIEITQGKYGGGYDLQPSSSDYWYIPANSSLSVSSQFTVEAWGTYDAVSRYGFFANNTVENQFNPYISTGNAFVVMGTNLGGGSLTPGQWFHAAVTYNGISYYLYINGALVDTDSVTGIKDFSGCWVFGQEIDGAGNCTSGFDSSQAWDGKMDDLRIYNYARTQKQILEDMNAGHPAVGSPVGSYAGYWKFDEGYGTTAYDNSINNNDGTITGAVWNNDGKFNKALYFDGTTGDYVQMPAITNITTGTPFTLSAWVKPEATGSYRTIMGYNSTHRLLIGSTGQMLSQQDGNFYSSAISDVPDDVWTHVIYWYDGTTEKWYINGKQSGAGHSTINSEWDGAFKIGQYDLANYPYKGYIDEIKVYTFALTEDEIRTEYNRGASVLLGAVSTESDGVTPSYSSDRSYCVPGDTSACDPPVAEWKFDEKTGTTAYDVTGSNDGSLGGGTSSYMPTWKSSAYCKTGSCLEFDGSDDYVNMGDVLDMGVNDMTISSWIKTKNSVTNHYYIASKALAGAQMYRYGVSIWGAIDGDEGKIQVLSSWDELGHTSYFSNLRVDDGFWHKIDVVFDRSANLDIYIDGVLDSSHDISTKVGVNMNSNNPFRVGSYTAADNVSPVLFFNGFIDDVKIYDYARTPAQIAWDYNRGEPVAYWRFDEGEGITAYDDSNNSSDGTLTSGPTWVEGKYGSAISFDGVDDYVSTSGLSFSNSSLLTTSFWVKPISLTGSWNHLIEYISGDWNGVTINTVDRDFRYAFTTNNGNIGWKSSGIIPNMQEWYFISYTFDGSKINFYVNGKIEDSSTLSGTFSFDNYHIGHPASYTPNAVIDDVRIYNYALTDQQVKQLYNQGSAVRFAP